MSQSAHVRTFLLDHATASPLPGHRAEGLGASLTVHLSVLALLAGPPPSPGGRSSPELAVTVLETVPLALNDPIHGDLAQFPFDVARVANATNLFPFLTDPLLFLDEARQKVRPSPDRLINPLARARAISTNPPLSAGDQELQDLVDRAWSRRRRWDNFAPIAEMLDRHDPQDGDAHLLMRRYLDQNLLQPYYDTSTRDPRFWVMLGLAADHARLVEFVAAFVRQYPSSRTTTELLFMLEEFAQASRDTLLMLLSTSPESDLADTQEASTPAFQIATRVYRQYEAVAFERGLRDAKSVQRYFDDIRLRILRTIVETTPEGYGRTDARFLAGRVLWEQNRSREAIEWWRDLQPDGRDAYAAASSAVADALAIGGPQRASEISRILGAEYRRWLEFSADRLAEFGYTFDTF